MVWRVVKWYTVSFVFGNNQYAAIHFPYKLSSLVSTRSLLPLTITQPRRVWRQERHYNVMVMNHLFRLFVYGQTLYLGAGAGISQNFISAACQDKYFHERCKQTFHSSVCACVIAGAQRKTRWHIVVRLHQPDKANVIFRRTDRDKQKRFAPVFVVSVVVCRPCNVTHAAWRALTVFNVFPEASSGYLSVQTLG